MCPFRGFSKVVLVAEAKRGTQCGEVVEGGSHIHKTWIWKNLGRRNREGVEESYEDGFDQNVLNTRMRLQRTKIYFSKRRFKAIFKVSLLKILQHYLKLARFTQDKDA